MIVGVLVEIVNRNVDRVFEYNVPDDLTSQIKIGIRVVVPFGNKTLDGFVVEIKDNKTTDKELKSVIKIIDSDIVLNDELLALGKYMQKKTISSLVSCYQVMLPKALKAKNNTTINIKYDTYYELNDCDISNIKGKQLEIIELIKKEGTIIRKRLVDISISSLNTLIKNNIIREVKKEHYRVQYADIVKNKKVLTEAQMNVVNTVINNSRDVYLLHGVTGSGKTEVYMEIIDYYLKHGKSAIVLVPEISLTPQMVNRFRERFGNNIAALHSALSDGEKYDEWRRIYRGEASIVIGARSAIFAPLKNIGIIIVDEEHSDSYKQSDPSPRYSAKDIAIKRSEVHNCSVVFGSATPSLEVMARAQKGVFKYLCLTERINGKSLPEIKIVDMNNAIKKGKGHFSSELISAIEDRLNKNEQIILLLNRRGYSSFVSCRNCGHTYKCPSCDITLTYHKTSGMLRCHYCGYAEKMYEKCIECGEDALSTLGVGTQKIEEELNKLFNARVLRMDYDTTTTGKGKHEKMIEAFKNHDFDILLGTQMVSKGLDFPLVTLVGVINADTSLNIPDFRSSENTFSLLCQVSGRSGRSDKEGKVIIQTFNPDHYAISFSSKHDYIGFYKKEMEFRRVLKYPPYFYLCNIRISGRDALYIYDEASKIKKVLEKNNNLILLGPNASSLYKLNNVFRFNIIIKYKIDTGLYEALNSIVDHYKANNKIKIDIDFNPSQML